MSFSKRERKIILTAIRQVMYFLLVFGFVFFMHVVAQHYHEKTFVENGIMENIQFGLLAAGTVLFFLEALIFKKHRSVLLLLSSFALLAAFREQDKFLDENLPLVSWKIGFLFPVAALFYAYRQRLAMKRSLLMFLDSPAFYMMSVAVIIIIPAAQCIGHRPFVADVLGAGRVAVIKELIEESLEAVGYFLIFLSSLECFLGLKFVSSSREAE